MAEPFIGQIIMFGGNFAPIGWALCDGQLLPIADNQALFSILGTTYGGDGRTTFGLPDLRGRVAVHPGAGPGLSTYSLGQKGGAEQVTLTGNEMPSHNHNSRVHSGTADSKSPVNNVLSGNTGRVASTYSSEAPDADMNAGAIANTGGNQPHSNVEPYQCVNFIIALVGIYPSRN